MLELAPMRDKALLVVDGAVHYAMHDKPDYVTQAIERMAGGGVKEGILRG